MRKEDLMQNLDALAFLPMNKRPRWPGSPPMRVLSPHYEGLVLKCRLMKLGLAVWRIYQGRCWYPQSMKYPGRIEVREEYAVYDRIRVLTLHLALPEMHTLSYT